MFLGAGAVDQSDRATPDLSNTISETTLGNSRSIKFFDRHFERQIHLVLGGTIVANVLMDGTTYMDMFDPMPIACFRGVSCRRNFSAGK